LAETVDREKSLDREIRAFHWVRLLAELPGRLAGTPLEREAAERVEAWIRDLGVDDVSHMPVAARPRRGLVVGFHLALGALGCWLGGVLGAALAVFAAWSFRRELREERPLATQLLPSADSVNVIGRAGSRTPSQRVVLSAHIDTAQAGWLFAPAVADLLAGGSRLEGAATRPRLRPGGLVETLLLLAAVLACAAWLGAEGFLVGFARFLIGAALAAGCAAALQWAWAAPTPGANDNASAVAAMLTCAEQLLAQLPEDVELWIVGTGAEEVGCCGMGAFVDAHPDWPVESTCFVNFECVGGGSLHYLRREGVLSATSYPPTLVELARRVAASGAFGEVTPADLMAATDGRIPASRGHPTLSIISLDEGGVPRRYHRLDDVPEALDMPTVIRAADFGAAVAQAALRGESGPIAIV
jgi:hypothetical protein